MNSEQKSYPHKYTICETRFPDYNLKEGNKRYISFSLYPMKEDAPYPTRLACNGFYYTGTDDQVSCYSCGLTVRNLSKEDDICLIHKQKSPTCNFANSIEDDMNESKITETNLPQSPTQASSNDDNIPGATGYTAPPETTLHREPINENKPTKKEPRMGLLGGSMLSASNAQTPLAQPPKESTRRIVKSAPKYPKFTTRFSRLETFKNCRNIAVTPENLSDAGFFYAGIGDCTRCFYCGIGLKHWDSEDNAWSEHRRFSPSCNFVLESTETDRLFTTDAVEVTTSANLSNDGIKEETTRIVDEKMKTSSAEKVRDMGFRDSVLRQAIFHVITSQGVEHLSENTIVEAIISLQENTSDSSTTRPPSPPPRPPHVEKKERVGDPGPGMPRPDHVKTGPDVKTKLQKENEELRLMTYCTVCKDNEVSIVFLPCGHLITCENCAPAVKYCSICSVFIKGTVKTYRS